MTTLLKKHRTAVILLVLTMIFSQSISCFAATGENEKWEDSSETRTKGKYAVKEFYFETDNAGALDFKPEEIIEIDGKKYKYKTVDLELFSEPVTIEKEVKSNDKEAPPTISQNVNGQSITLYAPSNIKWEDNSATLTKEYAAGETIPETIEEDGRTFEKKDVVATSRTEKVSTPAKFYTSDPENDLYIFNGKLVELDGGEPKWDGCLEDYAEYLGVEGQKAYKITGSQWTGKAKKSGDGYIRIATVYGTKDMSINTVTYGVSGDDAHYTANVTYKSKYIGHAAVTYKRYISTLQKVIYAGIGLFILGGMIALILFILHRKNEEKEDY